MFHLVVFWIPKHTEGVVLPTGLLCLYLWYNFLLFTHFATTSICVSDISEWLLKARETEKWISTDKSSKECRENGKFVVYLSSLCMVLTTKSLPSSSEAAWVILLQTFHRYFSKFESGRIKMWGTKFVINKAAEKISDMLDQSRLHRPNQPVRRHVTDVRAVWWESATGICPNNPSNPLTRW